MVWKIQHSKELYNWKSYFFNQNSSFQKLKLLYLKAVNKFSLSNENTFKIIIHENILQEVENQYSEKYASQQEYRVFVDKPFTLYNVKISHPFRHLKTPLEECRYSFFQLSKPTCHCS